MPLIVQHAALTTLAAQAVHLTSLTIWSRLEVQPTTPDYAPALEARVADPLWMMARQWQFGEFQGEDAGSPVEVRLEANQSIIERFHPGAFGADPAGAARDYDPVAAPLEALVEAEDPADAGLIFAAWSGQQFLRMLAASGLADTFSGDAQFAFVAPPGISIDLDRAGSDWAAIAPGRTIDGNKLATAIAAAGGVPAGVADAAGLKDVCLSWLDWYRGGLGAPQASSWQPNRLEYAYAASAGKSRAEQVLTATEYTDGRLDWYGFDLSNTPSLGGTHDRRQLRFNPMLPTAARFGGMPADRYWEFEDGRVNLAQVSAGPTDIGRLLLLEFALAYGNDWFLIPVELPVGALFQMTKFQVTDTFGQPSNLLRAANAAGESWRMFEMTAAPGSNPDSFLLAPAIDARLEGDPIEEVALFRDEMANMAWAVERKVQGPMGTPIDRYREASLVAGSQRLSDLSGVAPELIYRVATTVPEHWIPLVPVPKQGRLLAEFGIELERRAMLRHLPDGSVQPIQPKGILIRTDVSKAAADEPPIRLEDEEVPRDGALLTRSAQFTRWTGGERLHWIGRRKTAGKGEGASGLRYDILVKKDKLGAL